MGHMQEAVSKMFLMEKRNDADIEFSFGRFINKKAFLLSVLELKNN
jgi:hypothetical protein